MAHSSLRCCHALHNKLLEIEHELLRQNLSLAFTHRNWHRMSKKKKKIERQKRKRMKEAQNNKHHPYTIVSTDAEIPSNKTSASQTKDIIRKNNQPHTEDQSSEEDYDFLANIGERAMGLLLSFIAFMLMNIFTAIDLTQNPLVAALLVIIIATASVLIAWTLLAYSRIGAVFLVAWYTNDESLIYKLFTPSTWPDAFRSARVSFALARAAFGRRSQAARVGAIIYGAIVILIITILAIGLHGFGSMTLLAKTIAWVLVSLAILALSAFVGHSCVFGNRLQNEWPFDINPSSSLQVLEWESNGYFTLAKKTLIRNNASIKEINCREQISRRLNLLCASVPNADSEYAQKLVTEALRDIDYVNHPTKNCIWSKRLRAYYNQLPERKQTQILEDSGLAPILAIEALKRPFTIVKNKVAKKIKPPMVETPAEKAAREAKLETARKAAKEADEKTLKRLPYVLTAFAVFVILCIVADGLI